MLHSYLHPVPLYPMNLMVKRGIHSELLIDVLFTMFQNIRIAGFTRMIFAVYPVRVRLEMSLINNSPGV